MKSSCLDDIAADFHKVPTESYTPLVQTPPSSQCEVCVIVPVRNEAELLEGCLKALASQVDLKGKPLERV